MGGLLGPASLLARREGPGGFTTLDGKITLYSDEEEFDFHIDAKPGYSPEVMRCVLRVAARRGLEPLDEDECDPEILEDGTVRIYCSPIEGQPDVQKAVGNYMGLRPIAELLVFKTAVIA